jgi:hypothetical protein
MSQGDVIMIGIFLLFIAGPRLMTRAAEWLSTPSYKRRQARRR